MKSIIFFETNRSGSSREAMHTAKKIGYKVHLLTSNKKFLEMKDEFLEVDEMSLVDFQDSVKLRETILKIQMNEHVQCLISFIDSYVCLAASLSNELCGTNLSTDSFKLMEDKLLTREQFVHQPSSPYFYILTREVPLQSFINKVKHNLPLIVKLPKSCGSKNVYLVKTEAQLRNRLLFLRTHYDSDLLIEEYLNGPQVIVETIVHKGQILLAVIIEQEITKGEKFVVTGYSISNELKDTYKDSLLTKVKEVIRILGLENGNCHVELRHVQNVWQLIEVNPRISGGAMNDLIQEAYGCNYVEQILNVYMGNPPSWYKTKEDTVYVHYLTVDIHGKLVKVTGIQDALKQKGVSKVYIKPQKGSILFPPLSMGNRYGFVLAKGKTRHEAINNALTASSKIKFHLIPI